MERFWYIVKKEFILFTHDPKMMVLSFISPIIQLVIFGYAVTTDIRNIKTVIWDNDGTYESRGLADKFIHSEYFRITGYARDENQFESSIQTGRSVIGIHIPSGFERNIKRGRSAEVQVIVDGSDSNVSNIGLNYAQQIVNTYAEKFIEQTIKPRLIQMGTTTNMPKITAEVRIWYNPTLKSANYMVPGVLSLILLLLTSILTSMAITKERETGTMEQVIVTPVRPWELMIAKIVTPALVGFMDVIIIIITGKIVFAIPINGSLTLMFATSLLFLLTTLGLGLFASAVSQTQQQAMMTAFFLMLPQMLLSGFMFPIENMPEIIQYSTYLLPLRYFLVIVRGIFLKGVGVDILWPEILALAIFGVVILGLSSALFKKQLN
ncbi:MAG: ABC transporter permease [Elusimicrobiota bacterium]